MPSTIVLNTPSFASLSIVVIFAPSSRVDQSRSALVYLRERGHKQICAIMCAETMWRRCRRRSITDYLLASGETVFHILAPGHASAAVMTEAADVQADGSLVYPAKPARQGDLFDQAR